MTLTEKRLAHLEQTIGVNAPAMHALFYVEPDSPDNEFYGMTGDTLSGAIARKLDGLPAMRGIRCIEIVKPEKEIE